MRAAVITVSDGCSSGRRKDLSGPSLATLLESNGWEIAIQAVVPDDASAIQKVLASAKEHCDLLVTTGGTGVSSRDITPEAVRPILQKELPGYGELMRMRGMEKTPYAALSRSIAGTYERCLVICLPGSPRGAVESLQAVLPLVSHTLQILHGETEH